MKIAAVQAEPVWLDLEGGVVKIISLIKEAAANGAELVGFPEVFLPGYPMKIWSEGFDPAFFLKYQKASMSTRSNEYMRIRQAAREAGIWVVLGFSEIENGSLYIAQSFIDSHGEVALHRRKIKPTGQERTYWGQSQADSLQSAVQGPHGIIIGGLCCWENFQPLLRYHHYSLGVQIHVAGYPMLPTVQEGPPFQISADVQSMTSRFASIEGQMYTIFSNQVQSPKGAQIMGVSGTMWETATGGGFSAIFGPDGVQLTPPTKPDEEVIIYAEFDPDQVLLAKQLLDPVGHYSRPDLLSINVNKTPARTVHPTSIPQAPTLTSEIPPYSTPGSTESTQ